MCLPEARCLRLETEFPMQRFVLFNDAQQKMCTVYGRVAMAQMAGRGWRLIEWEWA
jgi:hypothetical protein